MFTTRIIHLCTNMFRHARYTLHFRLIRSSKRNLNRYEIVLFLFINLAETFLAELFSTHINTHHSNVNRLATAASLVKGLVYPLEPCCRDITGTRRTGRNNSWRSWILEIVKQHCCTMFCSTDRVKL